MCLADIVQSAHVIIVLRHLIVNFVNFSSKNMARYVVYVTWLNTCVKLEYRHLLNLPLRELEPSNGPFAVNKLINNYLCKFFT